MTRRIAACGVYLPTNDRPHKDKPENMNGTKLASTHYAKGNFGKVGEAPGGGSLARRLLLPLSLPTAMGPSFFCELMEVYCGSSLRTAETWRPLQSEMFSRKTKRCVVPGAVILTLCVTGHGLPK
jgi:hypothetical protein